MGGGVTVAGLFSHLCERNFFGNKKLSRHSKSSVARIFDVVYNKHSIPSGVGAVATVYHSTYVCKAETDATTSPRERRMARLCPAGGG